MLQERVWLPSVQAERCPRVPEVERLTAEELGCGISRGTLRFGFAEEPNVPAALRLHGIAYGLDPQVASFFVGRDVPTALMRPDLSAWEEAVFDYPARNAMRSSDYFRVPPNRVVE